MEKHYVYSNKFFSCSNCPKLHTVTFSSFSYYCRLIKKRDFEINDGDCPLTYEEFKEIKNGYDEDDLEDYYDFYYDDDEDD